MVSKEARIAARDCLFGILKRYTEATGIERFVPNQDIEDVATLIESYAAEAVAQACLDTRIDQEKEDE